MAVDWLASVDVIATWLPTTLRSYPELAIFLALAIGFVIGPIKLGGFSLGNVTATLLAAVAIGQLQISISGNVKATFFILFIFAIGYGVGPQFVSGLTHGFIAIGHQNTFMLQLRS